ncbi:class I SAM-dependent methyltransferase [archaeon]|nr:class I SAM-dependent methyltransferase [archaeon]
MIETKHKHRLKVMSDYVIGNKILDIGCYNLQNIYLKDSDGMDILKPEIKYNIFYKHDVNTDFPIKSNTYDTILAGEIIEHLNNPHHFLSECNRILKDNGRLILSTPNITNFFNIFVCYKKLKLNVIREFHDHIIELSPLSLKRLVILTGFKVIHHRGLAIPMPLISRINKLRGIFKTKNLFLSGLQVMVCDKVTT